MSVKKEINFLFTVKVEGVQPFGLAIPGLAGTRGLTSPREQVLSFKKSY